MSSAQLEGDGSAASEIESLKAMVAELQRGQRIERQKRLWSTIGVLAVAAATLATLRAEALTTAPQVLVCKELKVVGTDGKTKLDLYTGPQSNGGSIKAYGSSGTALVALGNVRDNDGSYQGSIGTYGDNGKERVGLAGETDTTAGAVAVYGADGKTRAALTAFAPSGASPNNAVGELVTCDANGKAARTFP